MDTQDQQPPSVPSRHNGRIFAGLFLLLIGGAFLMRELSFPFFPDWLFTWPMLLIAIGIYTGIKHEFRNPGWIIMVVIGVVFLADQTDLGFNFHRFLVPALIIAAGLIVILRPKGGCKRRNGRRWEGQPWTGGDTSTQQPNTGKTGPAAPGTSLPPNFSSQDFFDSTSIFGGVKKVIVSKNFRGGDITCFMGGCEVDFTQADIQQPAMIDVTQIFGGTKLIVPSHWQVRTEMTAIFGSVEDKRQHPLMADSGKVLILQGTSIFGGIEIRNY